MSKEQESFNRIKCLIDITDDYYDSDDVDVVIKGLKRLESIDHAEPSEASRSLEFICKILNEKRIDVKWLFKGDYNIIVQALHRLEAIEKGKNTDIIDNYMGFKNDNVESSEALKWFGEQWVEYGIQDTVMQIKDTKEFATIKQALIKAEKEHKILDIIKEKEVNMQVFNQCEDVETYNKVYIKQKDRQLSQEEFNLLKEVVE